VIQYNRTSKVAQTTKNNRIATDKQEEHKGKEPINQIYILESN